MSLELLTAEIATLLPGAEVVADISASPRAVTARLLHDGRSLIAKRHHDASALAKEVEAYRTLPSEFRAELVAASDTLLVIEDLGAGPALSDLLLGVDGDLAGRGLVAWAETLGATLRATMRRGQRDTPLDADELRSGIAAFAEHLDIAMPTVDRDLASLVAPLNATHDWFAFGPSDACPDNNRVFPDGSVKLFDFEGASWRHAASEAAYTIGPFCTCWCVAALPEGATTGMQDAFMDALDPPSPDGFREATRCAAILYVLQQLARFAFFLENDVAFGPPDNAPATSRQFVLHRLESVASMAADEPAIAALFGDLAAAVSARYPDASPMPLYNAFRS
jgi:hypothetical protein